MYMMPRIPSANGCRECFIGKPRNEPLDGEIIDTPREVQVIIERWHHNKIGPYPRFGCRPPASEAGLPTPAGSACAIDAVPSDRPLRSEATGTM